MLCWLNAVLNVVLAECGAVSVTVVLFWLSVLAQWCSFQPFDVPLAE